MMNQTFLDEVMQFRADLERASGWEELRELWQRNISPYRVVAKDPLSPEYKLEILGLYRRMTAISYDLANELTSTKVASDDFDRGYPWMTNDFGVAAAETIKTVQAFRVLQSFAPEAHRLVEFGSGWANLALAIARLGRDVTAVDIDGGFITPIQDLAQRHKLPIHTINADFLTAARAANNDFDAVIFQSSFHHCIDFNELLGLLRTNVLGPEGRVFFFSEPIVPDYPFPWGLRTDGESLWAITMNKWCELDFDRDFFVGLLHKHGFFGTATGEIAGLIGHAWVATPFELGLSFDDWTLPSRYDDTFHPVRDGGQGRFLRERSILPVHGCRHGTLTLGNHARTPLHTVIFSGHFETSVTVEPDAVAEVVIKPDHDEITLRSETFVPHEVYGNGDLRRVGLSLKRVCFS